MGVGPGESRDPVRVGTMPHGEAQAILFDGFRRRRLVVDRERGNPDAGFGQLAARALEAAELGGAVGAPRAAVEEDDAERTGEAIGEAKRPAAERGDFECGKLLAILQTDQGGFHVVDFTVHKVFRFELDRQVQCCQTRPMPAEKEPERRLTARGAAMRARLIEVAADLIYEKGVDRTSLDEVLEKSGASKSQLYHYFADKDALVLAVIRSQTERVLALQQPHLARLDSLAALQRWRDAVLVLAKAAPGLRGCPLGSLASELANRFEEARTLLAGSFDTWREQIEEGFEAMRARGELAESADPHALALAILAALQGGLLLAKTARTVRPLEAALDMALEHVARHATKESARKT